MLVTAVVPVFNAMSFLPLTVPTLLAAARRTGQVELRFVDNGSTDGSLEYLESLAIDNARVLRFEPKSIGGVRNFGARAAPGRFLSFIDADCCIPEDYFETAVEIIETTGSAATGCSVEIPQPAHWIEATWHAMHFVGRDRDVSYLNSANFFVRREAFDRVGGFREDLRTGEDAEIGQRIVAAGLRIRESTRVQSIHLGNPKSLGAFHRRMVWHGLGMFGTVNRRSLDKPTTMMFLHLAATIIGLAVILWAPWGFLERISLAIAFQLVIPALTVFYRIRQTRRLPRLDRALLLYWLYYWARARALFAILSGQVHWYWK